MIRPKLNRIWANNSSIARRDPGDAKYIKGWLAEIPTFQVLNYLQYKIDTTLLALAERGVFEWGPDITYGLHSLVWDDTDNQVYVAIVGAPDKTLKPSANSAHWLPSSIQIPRASYDATVAAINAHIADVTGNPHKLTAGRLNAYNKAELDAIVVQYQNLVASHASRKDNPHDVTAIQTGAVPITGGTYTGDVTFLAGVYFTPDKGAGLYREGGTFLKNNNTILGIDAATGTGVVGPIGNTSKIVTEATYAGLKSIQERDYATPLPNFQLDLLNSIAPRIGYGYVEVTDPVEFAPDSGALRMSGSRPTQQYLSSEEWFGAEDSPLTIAWDVRSPNNRVTDTSAQILFGIGYSANESYLFITGTGALMAERRNGSKYDTIMHQLSTQTGKFRRVVGVFEVNRITLYVDGVQVAQTLNPQTYPMPSAAMGWCAPKAAGQQRIYDVQNFRIWNAALTAKQVSTL